MAITWDINITNVDVPQKRADVVFLRIDDVTGATENYSFKKVIIETAQQKTALLDLAWEKHLETASAQSTVAAFITNLEQTAKSNLEAREV